MRENKDHGAPGRSLLAEMTGLREEMEALRTAMGMLVDLQRELHTKLEAANGGSPFVTSSLPPFPRDNAVECQHQKD